MFLLGVGFKNIFVDEEVRGLGVELGWRVILWLSGLSFECFGLFGVSVKIGVVVVGFLLWIFKWKFELILSFEILKKLRMDGIG